MFPRVLLFLSTPSARRATRRCCSRRHCGQYFYPRPLRGGRPGERGNFQDAGDFYPRPLRGGRRGGLAAFNLQAAISIHALCEEGDDQGCQRQPEEHENFYPRPLRGGRPPTARHSPGLGTISIHALCEEGDLFLLQLRLRLPISIHALCEEGDPSGYRRCKPLSKFLSTPSARRATAAASAWQTAAAYFYPRPLRGGRRGKFEQSNLDTDISIHALCEEGDPKTAKINANSNDFYPRPLRGGRQ